MKEIKKINKNNSKNNKTEHEHSKNQYPNSSKNKKVIKLWKTSIETIRKLQNDG